MLAKLASVRVAEIPVLELMNDVEATRRRVEAVGREAVEADRAAVLLLGCMTMSFLGIADEVSNRLGVPVINAGRAALKAAEGVVAQGLSHSKKAFPTPPKLRKKQVQQEEVLT